MNKSRKNLTIKALLAAVAMGFALNSPIAVSTVHAELVDETDEWDKQGTPTYEDTTDKDQNNNSNEQNANAKVDNSDGGSDKTTKPDEVPTGNSDPTKGEVTDWENYDPTKDPNWNPYDPTLPDGLQDEVDRKTPPIEKTADSALPYALFGIVSGAMASIGYKVIGSKKGFVVFGKDNTKTK